MNKLRSLILTLLLLLMPLTAYAGFISQPGGGTETDPIVGAITGIPVGDGAGNISTADASDLPGAVHADFDDPDHDAINCRYSTGSGDPAPAAVASNCHFYKDTSTSPVTWWAGVGGAGSNFERITDAAPGVTQVNGTSGSENCDGPCVITFESSDTSVTLAVTKAGSVPNEVITIDVQAASSAGPAPQVLRAQQHEAFSGSAALDTRNSIPILVFPDAADTSARFSGVMDAAYDGGTITVRLHTKSVATSGAHRWCVSWERDTTDSDADSFNTAVCGSGTVNGTSGITTIVSIDFTQAEADGLAAGEGYRINVMRDGDGTSGTDDAAADAQLRMVEIRP